jgi:hypothetical protein
MKNMLLKGLSTYFLFFSCGTSHDKADTIQGLDQQEAIMSGELLSKKYCQSCHLYPEPSILDRDTWDRSVLPLMGRRLGIYEEIVPRERILEGAINKKAVLEQNIFPSQQLISDASWKKIQNFYLSGAPKSLPTIERIDSASYPFKLFEIKVPPVGNKALTTTLLKIDPKTSQVYLGGQIGKLGLIRILNRQLELIEEIKLPSAPTDIGYGVDRLAVTLSGSLRLAPANNAFGELIYLLRNPGDTNYSSFSKFLNLLNRPVQTVFEDMDEDGFEDIIIAEFGYYTGALNLFVNSGGQLEQYKKSILSNTPGAVSIQVEDMNGDSHKDIVVLFAQGDERISIFFNNGDTTYKEETVLRFNPSYGSVFFKLVDMNKDGFPDILYCNGDNGDYPPILKNYHGIRIFENDGKNNFEQVFFYPMYGTFKCGTEDFDLDGDLDVVGISYFPDFTAENREDLVYLENEGNYLFSPHMIRNEMGARWVTLDIGDIDRDGFADIVLGSSGVYAEGVNSTKMDESVPSLVVLKNLGKEVTDK